MGIANRAGACGDQPTAEINNCGRALSGVGGAHSSEEPGQCRGSEGALPETCDHKK